MDGEAGTTVADRSTAAVGVANEGGEAPLAAQQSGATPDGTATDDQTSGKPDHDAARHPAEDTAQHHPAQDVSEDSAEDTNDAEGAEDSEDATNATDAGDARDTGADTEDAADAEDSTEDAADGARDDAATVGGEQDERTAEIGGAGPAESTAVTERIPPVGPSAPARSAAGSTPAAAARAKRSGRRELHSGHKLARRYQLEECVTRVDGFSSWRAVAEKLRRAVGVHILPADHSRARQVLAAARSAALLGDPRFVQVLDAVEESDLVYVINEWLPDAMSLADLLPTGPLEPHEAYQMVAQVAQGMSAAHREGLAHLRLDPGAVLRTNSGQYRIRGLAVTAALRGLTSDRPQRDDTRAIGALLYASLTQRWPYEEDAHGLAGLPKGVGLVAPDQVRAGVHRGLSELAMRALVNDGATASREEAPYTTPEELAKAVAGMPRIRPPEQPQPVYTPTAFQPPAPTPHGATRPPVAAPMPPPALPGRTGQFLKWAVAALLIVAIGLGSWQLADALKSNENSASHHTPSGQKGGQDTPAPKPKTVPIVTAKDFDPFGSPPNENPEDVPKAYDGDPTTYWQTSWYTRADLGGLKPGVGVILDLGSARNVSSVKVGFIGVTSVDLMAAPQDASAMPTTLDGFTRVASGSGEKVTLRPGSQVTSRYVLVWLTRLPVTPDGRFRGRISEISVTG